MTYYEKKLKKLLNRINDLGKVLGYPLFVMPDGTILKTPPQDVPFKLIVFDELDLEKSLEKQAIQDYETWLGRTPGIISPPQRQDSTPQKPVLPDSPEMFQIPPHLKPKAYEVKTHKIYIYAEEDIKRKFSIDIFQTGKINIYLFDKELKMKQCSIKKDGLTKNYFYIYKN